MIQRLDRNISMLLRYTQAELLRAHAVLDGVEVPTHADSGEKLSISQRVEMMAGALRAVSHVYKAVRP